MDDDSMASLQGSLEAGLAAFDVVVYQACAYPHDKGDLRIGQVRVVPEDQCFALQAWKGAKGCHEEGFCREDGWPFDLLWACPSAG